MKKWYQSKTIIFNILSVVLAILMYTQTSVNLDSNTKDLIVGAIGIINVFIRMNTSMAVEKSIT